MTATEIHNFLSTRPTVEAMRLALKAEGVDTTRPVGVGSRRAPISKEAASLLLLDLMVERR